MPAPSPTPDQLNRRLEMLWFYNTYLNIPVQKWNGWTPQPYPPEIFNGPAPVEYLPPFPDPPYWPAPTPTVSWPSWYNFWGGIVPAWPPVYPPVEPYFPPLIGGLNNFYEELCCVGFNPDESILEAIITIKQQNGYGGGLCSYGTFEYVGFWLIEQSLTLQPPLPLSPEWGTNPTPNYPGKFKRFIGNAKVNVFDISRLINDTTDPKNRLVEICC